MMEIQRLAKEHNEIFMLDSVAKSVPKTNKLNGPTETQEENNLWNDTNILYHIMDSLLNSEDLHNSTVWDFEKTEKSFKQELANYHSKTKYLVLYVCIVLPLFIINYIQNELQNRFDKLNSERIYPLNYSFSESSKRKRNSKNAARDTVHIQNLGKVMLQNLTNAGPNSMSDSVETKLSDDNLNPYIKILIRIYHFLTGNNLSLLSPRSAYSHSEIQEKLAAQYGQPISSKICNEFGDSKCPGHTNLCSTDEASSNDADFDYLDHLKNGKGKVSK